MVQLFTFPLLVKNIKSLLGGSFVTDPQPKFFAAL